MASQYVWLSTSLFCLREHWHTVLTKGIQSFLMNPLNKKHIRAYQVKFNYANGENIRFLLLADTRQALYLAQQLDAFFTGFFAAHSFNQQGWRPFNGSLFSNFPANTIQYGLYNRPGLLLQEDLYKVRFETKFSQMMIRLLGDESVDADKIITIAFYLHIAWIKAHMLHNTALTVEQFAGFHNIYPANKENAFSNIKDQFIEIYNDIIHQPVNGLPEWLQKWVRICSNELKRRNEASAEDIYKHISHIISTYFGLSPYMQSLLFHGVVTAISTQSQEFPC